MITPEEARLAFLEKYRFYIQMSEEQDNDERAQFWRREAERWLTYYPTNHNLPPLSSQGEWVTDEPEVYVAKIYRRFAQELKEAGKDEGAQGWEREAEAWL